MLIKCVVACRNICGSPIFFPCLIESREEQYDSLDHYSEARSLAADKNCESCARAIVFDENDGPKWLFEHFDWSKVAVSDITDK